ncbi:PQQ-dependent sugar dehydrogenase [Thalassotalea piscium]|uniref:Glucose/arabinose dehydrogenase n=1 Tax=Thalassotalea piscium TaxID=1230533 RepID=A0A7X0NIQ4_9GAMM|nr:PQQ-dependent sugar dehydrogenase [Thalassotalea piscium]MBB6544194.1 glucose/arabinose dehydrogenase [Thalassotalea piscium]
MKLYVTLFLALLLSKVSNAYDSQPMLTNGLDKNISANVVVKGVSIPWAMVQLPSKEIVISERSGELRVIKNNRLLTQSITGLPEIHSNGQGGLLDLALHPQFSKNQWLYFTFASPQGEDSGSNTALMRAKLNITTMSLTNQQLLYKATPNTQKGQHYGSRIVFDDKGYVYFSIGDRGQRDLLPQDISKDGGKIYRLHDDGSIPIDNPFVTTEGAKTAIYSYGHRNPQGLSIDPVTQNIWSHEHGPRGGDEVNIIKKGANYGWPLVSYGINYSGTTFTDKTEMQGMQSPALHWTPSIAPSGMIYVSSDKYPSLKGKFLAGSMKFNHLVLLTIQEKQVISQERVFENIGRTRSLLQGNDGYIYVGIDGEGIKRLEPK